jgi:hypothetical protein
VVSLSMTISFMSVSSRAGSLSRILSRNPAEPQRQRQFGSSSTTVTSMPFVHIDSA